MEILKSLGVNQTIWIQLACFVIAYLALSRLVFRPYMAAFHERASRTTGSEQYADRVIDETHQLRDRYESRAREINHQSKKIYDETRVQATRSADELVSKARHEVQQLLSQNREQIEREVSAAKAELERQVPAVGLAIASKLVGKELAQ